VNSFPKNIDDQVPDSATQEIEQDMDDRYDHRSDSDRIKSTDLRKIRLTLWQIGKIRRSGEAHRRERAADLERIKMVYAPQVEGGQ